MQETTMTDIIFDYYTSRIQFGYYRKGDHLPSISYIRNQFQVSKLTVTLALTKIKDEGYIETAERRPAVVIYSPDGHSAQTYADYSRSRNQGMYDIYQSAGILFNPIARFYLKKHDAVSMKRIRSRLKRYSSHASRQLLLFYAEAMQKLQNPLALNLYWEIVRYLRFPYLHDTVDFEKMDGQAAEHIKRMFELTEAGCPDKAAEEMISFSADAMRPFYQRLYESLNEAGPIEQIPFQWHIYRERPQLCYSVAAGIISQIDRQAYKPDEFLPSCQALAQECGVSVITMRRALALLCHIGMIEIHNGVGARAINGGERGSPDFSQPQIRKSLTLFLQALQLSALTCQNVAADTLSSLNGSGFRALAEQIQLQKEEKKTYLVGEICHQFIGENSPSALVREVYLQLYQLLLWGHALHIFFQKPEGISAYTAYADGLLECLQSRDIEGFSSLLSELFFDLEGFTRKLFRQLGILNEPFETEMR